MTGYPAWSSKRVSYLISTHPSIMISIINQIQTSITGEAIDRLDRYDEIQQNIKMIQDRVYTRQNTSPLKPSHRDDKHQDPQRNKMSLIKGFGENVSQLPFCINVFHRYVAFLNMVSQEVASYFYVFRSPMKNWVLG
jgi:hypothetical protein